MKLSIDRKEEKGPFGGAYYITSVKVELTAEEETIAKRQKIFGRSLVGGSAGSKEGSMLMQLCDETTISMRNLTMGVRAKAQDGKMLGLLVEFENLVRERCKSFKSRLEADSFFGGSGSSSEEII
jgi:hypothetical protein